MMKSSFLPDPIRWCLCTAGLRWTHPDSVAVIGPGRPGSFTAGGRPPGPRANRLANGPGSFYLAIHTLRLWRFRPTRTSAKNWSRVCFRQIAAAVRTLCLDSAWVYCLCFWTVPWRSIRELESALRFHLNSDPLDRVPIGV